MKIPSVFFIFIFLPFLTKANILEYSLKKNGDMKYDIHATIENSKIDVIDHFNSSWSFTDSSSMCQDGNKSRILLRSFYIDNVADMNNIIFITYIMSCKLVKERVKYVAIYNGIPYILSGYALTTSVSDDWETLIKSGFQYNASENLRGNKELLSYMIRYWPSQIILIR